MSLTHTTRSLSTEAARAARRWYVADADGKILGRLASRVAQALRGKNNPAFSPHIDAGDFVVVVNAAKIALLTRSDTNRTPPSANSKMQPPG